MHFYFISSSFLPISSYILPTLAKFLLLYLLSMFLNAYSILYNLLISYYLDFSLTFCNYFIFFSIKLYLATSRLLSRCSLSLSMLILDFWCDLMCWGAVSRSSLMKSIKSLVVWLLFYCLFVYSSLYTSCRSLKR